MGDTTRMEGSGSQNRCQTPFVRRVDTTKDRDTGSLVNGAVLAVDGVDVMITSL